MPLPTPYSYSLMLMPTHHLALYTDSLHPSGVGRVMELLAKHLPSYYERFLICAEHPGTDELVARMRPYVSEISRFTLRWDTDVAKLPELVTQLQAWRIDIFHNHIGATWEGDWGTIAARCAHVPIVVATDHIPCVLKLAHELERRRQVNGLLDRQFAVSESVRQSLIECDLIALERAFTIDNGVEAIEPRMSRKQARHELGLPANVPVALFLGRLVEQKDPYVLLHSLALLNKRGLRTMAVFAGDGDVRHATEQEARRVGVDDQVRFLGNCTDIAPLFAAADVLAMPSRFEGLPLAALEAMSCGLPIVGCNAPGVRDVVTHNENGWLAPIADPEAFSEGLARAFSPEINKRWGCAARQRFETQYTAQAMAARQDQAYQEVVG